MYYLLFAFLSPFIWGATNVIDKYLVDHRIKHILGFNAISGIPYLLFGILLAAFLDWKMVSGADLIAPAIIGILVSIQFYLYLTVLENDDVSHVVGFMYIFPIFVAITSFIVLGENIGLFGYIGMSITVIGIILLSVQRGKSTVRSWLVLASLVALTTVMEIAGKISVSNLTVWQSSAATSIVLGISLLASCALPSIRQGAIEEFKRIHVATVCTALEIVAMILLFAALAGLPVTMVSAIGAMQPLFVLGFEWITHRYVPISKHDFKKKLIAITLVVIGVVLVVISSG